MGDGMKQAMFVMGVAAVLALGLQGCSKREDGMGPAQQAGQAVDNAGDKVAKDLHDKLDKANAAAQQTADAARETRDGNAAASGAEAGGGGKGLAAATEKGGERVEQGGEKMQGAAK